MADNTTTATAGPRTAKIVVRFDQQQRKLLDFLRAEKTFGTEDGEIIRNVVLDWLSKAGGEMTDMQVPQPGPSRLDFVLEPVMGRAIPVKKGETSHLDADGRRATGRVQLLQSSRLQRAHVSRAHAA